MRPHDARPASPKAPPRLAARLLALTAPEADRECMLGDLEEEFARRTGEDHGADARSWYWGQVLRSAPANLMRRLRDAASSTRATRDAFTKRKGDPTMTSLLHDLRFAWRSMHRDKRLTATIVFTLALGIAVNTVIFSVIDGVVLSPFPFPEPERLVGIGSAFPKLQQDVSFWENLSPAEFVDLQKGSRTLSMPVAWDMGNRQISEGGATENVFSAFWWGDALRTLGVRAEAGRGFSDDEIAGGRKVAIVSHRFWTNRMGADPGRVGSPLIVNGESYTLVGVLPRSALIYGTDLWLPMPVGPEAYPRGRRQFQVLARVAEGKSLEDVNTELALIAARTDSSFRAGQPEYEKWRLEARTFVDINVGMMRPVALVLFLAALFVLLIACVNVASLLLARAMERSREMAMRITLGARRGQILRQLVCESTLHASMGALVGALLASQGVTALQYALSRVTLPIPGDIALSARVLSATMVISLLSGFLFGLAPALYTLRKDIQGALRAEGATTTGSIRRLRAHRFFVGFQMAFAALLVVCSGLLIRSLIRLQSVDSGMASREVLGFRTTLATERYRNPEAFERFFDQLTTNLAALPGVTNVGVASQVPPGYISTRSFLVEGEEIAAEGALKNAYFTAVSPGYFPSVGIGIRQGRGLAEDDRAGSPPVVVMNEAAARQFFPDGDVLGKRLRFGKDADAIVAEVVGVATSIRNRGLDRNPAPEIFVSLSQIGYSNQLMTVIRTTGDPLLLSSPVRDVVKRMDALQPIYSVQTLEQAFASQGIQRRIATFALLIFAAFALLLAGAGVYSVASYAAAARTREIGVRMAVGATAGDVRRLVARQALRPVLIGAAFGIVAAAIASQGLGRLLFEVRGYDPITMAGSLIVLAGVALIAADGPARRASRTDLASALSNE